MSDTRSDERQRGAAILHMLSERRGMPMAMHLQIADRCNHACVHCYQIQGLKGELSTEQVFSLLDDLADAGVLQLNVSGGEATLRPDLIAILRHARRRGFAIRLYTNAFAVTETLADEIAAVGVLEVHVSVYSDDPSEHDAVTKVPGSLARTLEGIRRLRARGVRVVMKSPGIDVTVRAKERLARLAASLGCVFAPSSSITPREDGSLLPMATQSPNDELIEMGLLTPWIPSEGDVTRRQEKLEGASCGVCTSSAVILPNGDVLPCSDTIVPLGNLLRQKLPEIYQQNPDVGLFRDLRWKHVHGCRDCDLLLACHRCHATALQQQGDYLGPYAAACERARARYAAGLGRDLEIRPATPACGPDRDVTLGPYRIEAPGVLVPIPDLQYAEDDARAQRHPWLRAAHAGSSTSAVHSRPENLVFISKLRRRSEAENAQDGTSLNNVREGTP